MPRQLPPRMQERGELFLYLKHTFNWTGKGSEDFFHAAAHFFFPSWALKGLIKVTPLFFISHCKAWVPSFFRARGNCENACDCWHCPALLCLQITMQQQWREEKRAPLEWNDDWMPGKCNRAGRQVRGKFLLCLLHCLWFLLSFQLQSHDKTIVLMEPAYCSNTLSPLSCLIAQVS